MKRALLLVALPLATALLLPSAAPKSHVAAAHVAAAPLPRAPQPILKLSNPFRFTLSTRTYLALNNLDGLLVKPAVKLGNHGAALASLAYFGLISTTMMTMPMPAFGKAIIAAITAKVGPTSNEAFSAIFPTLVTPASFVFLIWPFIAALQTFTLSLSILRPGRSFRSLPRRLNRVAGPPMAQTELTSLFLANSFAATWLIIASNAVRAKLPLGSLLALPFVPLFAGLPLRTSTPLPIYRPLFQVFSSFTTIATFLALTIELQHGGRIAWFLGKAEPCGLVFATLSAALVSLPGQCLARQLVNCLAFTGILWKRLGLASLSSLSVSVVTPLLKSPSFVGLLAVWAWAVFKLLEAIRPRRKWKPAPSSPAQSSPSDGPAFGERGVFF